MRIINQVTQDVINGLDGVRHSIKITTTIHNLKTMLWNQAILIGHTTCVNYWQREVPLTNIHVFDTKLDLAQVKKDARRSANKIIKTYSDIINTDGYLNKKSYQSELAEQLNKAPQTSKLHDHYNLFTFPYQGIVDVYKEAIKAFNIVNPYTGQYCVHAWLNYQHKGEMIPWHNHWKGLSGLDWTFVATCYINAESSVTTYKDPDGTIYDHQCKNNTISIFEDIGDIHRVSEWTEEEPRITISMDFVPIAYVQGTPYIPNTWMPIINIH
jgi:hypothetical protein